MIDTTIRFNDHNSYKVTSLIMCYPFGVEQMDYITHSFQAYATSSLASATRARTKFFDADGATISDVSHSFAVTTVFGKVDITVAVPATAVQAQLVLLQGGTDWWIAEPKTEQGEVATPYNVNYQGQLTYITPNGIYTGMMTAGQIVVAGTTASPDETLDTKLVVISNGMINLSSTVSDKTTKITNEGVYTGEISATQITVDQIVGPQIADGAVSNAKIANLAVDNAKIANLHGSKITANSITADKINVTNLYVDTVRGLSDSKNYAKFFASGDESSMTIYSPGTDGVSRRRGRIQTYGTTAISFNGYLGTWGSGTSEGVLSVGLLHGNAGISAWNGSKVEMTFGTRRLGINSTGFYKDVDGVVTYF